MRLAALARAALVSVLVAACGAPAQQPVTQPKPVATAPQAAPVAAPEPPLPLDARVRKGTLANGLTYYVLAHGKPEHRAQIWLAVNAGSVLEDDDQRGLAHFVEHMGSSTSWRRAAWPSAPTSTRTRRSTRRSTPSRYRPTDPSS